MIGCNCKEADKARCGPVVLLVVRALVFSMVIVGIIRIGRDSSCNVSQAHRQLFPKFDGA